MSERTSFKFSDSINTAVYVFRNSIGDRCRTEFMTICTWILPVELCPSGCAHTSI